MPEDVYATSTPRTSVDSAISIHETPQSKHKQTPRKSLTPKSAVSSLRTHLHRHHNSKRSRRGSISNVFSRHTSNASAGARGPETFERERPSHDSHRTSVSGGQKTMMVDDLASLVPLPSSPIAIPTPPPPALKLDLGPPAALSPFAEMGEAGRLWEAQVLHGKPNDIPSRLFDRDSPGRPLPKTPSSLDLVGMVPMAFRTSQGGKTPGQGRLLMTPTPLEPDDPFADMSTPMPGTSRTLDLEEDELDSTKRGFGPMDRELPPAPAPSADIVNRVTSLEPSDPFPHLQVSQVSLGATTSSISSLKPSGCEINSVCSGGHSSLAKDLSSDRGVDASALDPLEASLDELARKADTDASTNASVQGSSPSISDLKIPADEEGLWEKIPSHGPPSPTRKVQLPIRSTPVKQPVIHKPEVGVCQLPCATGSSLMVQQRFFPSALADGVVATPQATERRELSLDTTSSTISASSFHDSVLSPMSSSLYDEAVQELPPLSRCKSTFDISGPAQAEAIGENSSPFRTPSMGDKVAFELQRSERNARYNSIHSAQFVKIVHYDTDLQLPDYDNAGPDSQHTTPRSTDSDRSEEDGGVRLGVESEPKKSSEDPVRLTPPRPMNANASFQPKRLRFASRLPSASVDSAAPTTTIASKPHASGSDKESIASQTSIDS